MKPAWRRHAIVCLSLGLLALPVYWLDLALNRGGGSGNWIALDFRGLIFWSYIGWLAINVVLSSVGLLAFPGWGVWRIHAASTVLSAVLLVTGLVTYGNLRQRAISNEYRALMERRRVLINVIELTGWRYYPDDVSPTQIYADVVVHDSGRFAGNVTGNQTDPSGGANVVFQSTNGPESQRQVGKGEAFTYVFPLEILRDGQADDVRITLYLFKARSGPAEGDVEKVFMKSPRQQDDGQYFYAALPAPSQASK
jgi:hypothetical protein